MTVAQWLLIDQKNATIRGQLTRDTVPDLWRQLSQWQFESGQFYVNLQQLERVDSAAMVILLHLIEHAKNQNCHIMLRFVPNQLQTLFTLSNVEQILKHHIQA